MPSALGRSGDRDAGATEAPWPRPLVRRTRPLVRQSLSRPRRR